MLNIEYELTVDLNVGKGAPFKTYTVIRRLCNTCQWLEDKKEKMRQR